MKEQKVNFLENLIYGVCMGIFEVVPGISGGTLAFVFGIYETLINAISNLKKDFKNSFKVLFPNIVGMGIGVYCFSFIISFLNEKFPMEVSFWLTGLIIGIVPSISKEAFSNLQDCYDHKNVATEKIRKYSCFFSFVLTILVMAAINYFSFTLQKTNNIITTLNPLGYLKFGVVGMLAAFCLMLPGCSGSLIMLVFGIYFSVINAIHNFNFSILVPVGVGVLLGLFLGSKIIAYCLKKFRPETFFAILGLVVGSTASPFLNFLKSSTNLLSFKYILIHGIFAILTLAFGCVFSNSFTNKFKAKN